ncbi:MAG: hypothetical protein M3313_04485 [Actinomycetota bacterium]|nr:hypothetical protein [Actinomycetota bacterium]
MAEDEKGDRPERDGRVAPSTGRRSLFGDPYGVGRPIVPSEILRDVGRIAVGLGVAAVWLRGVKFDFDWKDHQPRAVVTLLLTALLIRGMYLVYRALIRAIVRLGTPRDQADAGIAHVANGTYVLDVGYVFVNATLLILLSGRMRWTGLYVEVQGLISASSAAVIILMVQRFWPFSRWGI